MYEVKIGVRGTIHNGDYAGWYLFVEPGAEGGYTMLLSDASYGETYDQWVESYDEIAVQVADHGWEIEWPE